jgi:predicted DNA-binding transcriptional regulator AlpA
LRRLLTDREAAQVCGVGDRTYAELIATADWLPEPIVLGPRLRRWDLDELLEALRTRAPRGTKGSEPAQLRRARIERLKAGGSAQAGA